MNKKQKGRIKFVAVFFGLLIILVTVFYIYVYDYYRADEYAKEIIAQIDESTITDDYIVFYPEVNADKHKGLIFYPGAKVEHTAYAPLLKNLSQEGITCVLIRMPFNLAFFGMNLADEIYSELPEITDWYIGGHSLGGAMASSYARDNTEKLSGVILLGAYPASQLDIPILTVYGSEDEVLNKTKLIKTHTMLEIVGGNHAYFGNYGEQEGDGIATFTREEQQEETINAIISFLKQEY